MAPSPSVAPTPASRTNPAANLPVPELPAAAQDDSEAGLEAFTRYWLELLAYSYEANDLVPLMQHSDPTCTFCQDAATAMAQVYQVGWVSSGAITLTSFTTEFIADQNGVYTAEITTTQGEIFYFSGEGWLGSSESKPDTPHTITARHTGDEWQMIDYTTPVPAALGSSSPGTSPGTAPAEGNQ
ncbi:DUF6318 family protein [Arthrobacter sp. SX1312]|uniref:DUF6318 family protein n=1 Tax=Arthrobacter sp. SX1312 TaxID=2058896 RepID=UPI0011B099D4|nr:DUF6318 family protein [Arthrobacter sp. SX1312]